MFAGGVGGVGVGEEDIEMALSEHKSYWAAKTYFYASNYKGHLYHIDCKVSIIIITIELTQIRRFHIRQKNQKHVAKRCDGRDPKSNRSINSSFYTKVNWQMKYIYIVLKPTLAAFILFSFISLFFFGQNWYQKNPP